MQKYVNAGGKVVKGLQNRRAEEAQLLMNTQGTGTQGTGANGTVAQGTGTQESGQYTDADIEMFSEIA